MTLGGWIFRIGMKGSEEGPKECPTHLIMPEIGGNN